MSKDYLLEVGMEEIPARFLLSLMQQLKQRVGQFLDTERIKYDSIQAYATPRRLAVLVEGIADKQSDLNETVKGPSLKVAQNEAGEWSKAALGFMRGQKATEADIIVENDYIFVEKHVEGEPVETVLPKIVSILKQMNFPVTMHWSDQPTAFIRPIHWMVSLLNEQVIPFEFVGITADRVTRGHRFLGEEIALETATHYAEKLKGQAVIAGFAERRDLIRQQIEMLALQNNWNVPISDDLLEEVTALVEWPTAFYGEFEAEYLKLPRMILITAMRDHQRYFYAEDLETGELLPIFISVRNGNDQHIDNVIKGNKKVLKARLEDGLFFYEDDLKQNLDFFVEKLAHVNEHVKVGSLAEKQIRVTALLDAINQSFIESGLEGSVFETAKEAAAIYKFDLMTQTVGEFAELQGQMGQLYAENFGLSNSVAEAIGSQYLPVTSGGELPETEAGALLALADKLDTLFNYFRIDMIPTGSADPYALRRQAMGLVEIIFSRQWRIDLLPLLSRMTKDGNLNAEQSTLINEKLVNFIKARVQQHLEQANIDYDIIQAVLKVAHLNVYYTIEAANYLQGIKQDDANAYRAMAEALTRVVNLGVKVEEAAAIDTTLAQTTSESLLLEELTALSAHQLDSAAAYSQQFLNLVTPISNYFEENMVNADDEAIKRNRQATMKVLTQAICQMMDPRELISKF